MQNYKVIHGACKVLVRNVILIYSDKYNNAIMPKIIPRIINTIMVKIPHNGFKSIIKGIDRISPNNIQ